MLPTRYFCLFTFKYTTKSASNQSRICKKREAEVDPAARLKCDAGAEPILASAAVEVIGLCHEVDPWMRTARWHSDAHSPFGAGASMSGISVTWPAGGWGARIRTWEWRYQKPLPYRLATPQCRACSGEEGLSPCVRRRADSLKARGHQAPIWCFRNAIRLRCDGVRSSRARSARNRRKR